MSLHMVFIAQALAISHAPYAGYNHPYYLFGAALDAFLPNQRCRARGVRGDIDTGLVVPCRRRRCPPYSLKPDDHSAVEVAAAVIRQAEVNFFSTMRKIPVTLTV